MQCQHSFKACYLFIHVYGKCKKLSLEIRKGVIDFLMSDMQEAQILVDFCLYRDGLITANTLETMLAPPD